MWNSYQWDNGIWMLPTAADFVVVSYDKAAFDTAGLTYPSEKWGLSDLIDAATKLTQKDASGKVTQAGIGISDAVYPSLFRSLLANGLFDTSTIPNPPKIDTADTENLLNTWYQLQQNGSISTSFNVSGLPLSVALVSQSMRVRQSDQNRAAVLLPGGKAGLSLQGFAVSGGTRYPEQAYAFASFLTTRAEVVQRSSILAARKSLSATTTSGSTGGTGGAAGGPGGGGPGGGGVFRNLSADTQALIMSAADNAIPVSETRFADNLEIALQNMSASVDAKAALQAIDATLETNLKAAADKKSTLALTVATPVPDPVLQAGQVQIKFGVSSFITPLPNLDKWNAVIKDFLAANTDVGAVTLDTIARGDANEVATLATNYDCFTLDSNVVPSVDVSALLNIDPFLTADTSFNKDDVIPGVMSQIQRDNKTWAFPLYLQPDILRYDSVQFNKYGVPVPAGSWTIQSFTDALKALKPDPSGSAPFISQNSQGTYLLLLIAAFGGTPFDYSTNPVTINFTDQKTVDAIQQVLDLAKSGYIQYDALSSINFAFAPGGAASPIYTDVLNGFVRNRGPRPNSTATEVPATDYKPIAYPTGTERAAASYTIGTGYVSAKTANPEACYRWLSTVAKHTELFSSMPARASLISDPALAATQGADLVALYTDMLKVLQSPTTVVYPSLGGGAMSGALLQMWLYNAFDAYVVNNGDLAAALKDAEGYAKAFQDCVNALPPYDPATQNQRSYFQQYGQCATKADPNVSGFFR
jgi:ABC-type glycerol-3-phosphate transport system substrate-binding protein